MRWINCVKTHCARTCVCVCVLLTTKELFENPQSCDIRFVHISDGYHEWREFQKSILSRPENGQYLGRARGERTETTDQYTQIIDRVMTVFLYFIIKCLWVINNRRYATRYSARLMRYDAPESVNRMVVGSVSRVIYSFRTIRRVWNANCYFDDNGNDVVLYFIFFFYKTIKRRRKRTKNTNEVRLCSQSIRPADRFLSHGLLFTRYALRC